MVYLTDHKGHYGSVSFEELSLGPLHKGPKDHERLRRASGPISKGHWVYWSLLYKGFVLQIDPFVLEKQQKELKSVSVVKINESALKV